MKQIIAVAGLMLCISVNAQTQTNTPSSFFQTTVGYFTSFNTNLDGTFGSTKGTIWTGIDSLQGRSVNLANSLGVAYKLGKSSLAVEAQTRTSGIAGTFVDQELGLSLNFIVHDTKLSLYGRGGYEFDLPSGTKEKDKVFGEFGIRAQKALTEHTYAGVGLGMLVPKSGQVFTALIGVTF
jgi:hypothetical protein